MDDWLPTGIALAAATVRTATPLVLAALGGLIAERAGVVDLGLEGRMLVGAFGAAAVAAVTGDPWLGLAAAVLASVMLALVHAGCAIAAGGDQVVSGLALNIVAAGVTPTLAGAWFALGGRTPALPPSARFGEIGPFHGLVYLTVLLVPLVAWLLAETRFGLRLRAAGDNPAAVRAAGLSVAGVRMKAILLSGVLCGLAGASLSIAQGAGFIRDMTAGMGYLAVAAVIFGGWRPFGTVAACLVFALADAAQLRLQGVSLPLLGVIPVQFVQSLPYAVTILLLAGVAGRPRVPRSLGRRDDDGPQ